MFGIGGCEEVMGSMFLAQAPNERLLQKWTLLNGDIVRDQ